MGWPNPTSPGCPLVICRGRMLVVKLTQCSQHTPLEDLGCLNDWNEVMCVEMFGKLCLTWKINIEIRDQTKPCLHPFSQDCSWWNCDNQAPYGLSHSFPFWALSQNNTAPSPCELFYLFQNLLTEKSLIFILCLLRWFSAKRFPFCHPWVAYLLLSMKVSQKNCPA